ncbi:MAG TPA: hypothetical protein VFS40_04970 [Gemmatimonadales bacterium]|nr:hypothetical protein [Gemmatimonadales bacterium]
MTDPTDITPAPDRGLGALLRETYAGRDDAAFVARLEAAFAAATAAPRSLWDQLGAWARPGLAAAAVALLAAGGYLGWQAAATGGLAPAGGDVAAVPEAANGGLVLLDAQGSEVLRSPVAPEPGVLLASLLETP